MPSSFAPRFDPWNSSSTGHQVAPSGRRPRRSTTEASTSRLASQFRAPLSSSTSSAPRGENLFAGVVVYIDGCTAPLVSDHRLRCLLVSHGATLANRLARRLVTHVVLSVHSRGEDDDEEGEKKEEEEGGKKDGAPCSSSPMTSSRNALSASKMEAEVRRRRVAGVRYVDVRWILESIEAGRRLPESRFPALVRTGPVLRFNKGANNEG
ncbi:hypothetical protein CP533_1586 [Ophiocordyceps camponoti-saundersi (nom. inval.)]|nr:hypothetical protein CP533_1586 [Ophiocordyceps camponoti-saundersi (nom. inval.)]